MNIPYIAQAQAPSIFFKILLPLGGIMKNRWMLLKIVAGMVFAALPALSEDCANLSRLTLPATTFSTVQAVPAGSFSPPTGAPLKNLPAFCRVAGEIKPSNDSHIQFEVWLPASGWNGKFQGIGNGGFAGAIEYNGLADAVQHGYAAASTDTGHQGSGTDAAWALGHPEKIVDFGHRAIHEMTDKAKTIVAAYYGSSPQRSYFCSCSNGGRQALMEAQRYPADYDGIIAGAPANYWTHLLLSAVSNLQATAGQQATYIPPSKLPAIQAAVLAACDADDGIKDGVIENPSRCRFDPAVLQCQGAESERCLTAPQVQALKKLYDGTRSSSGKLLFPGYSPGGEADPAGWRPWITGPAPNESLLFAFGTGFYRNMVFNNPAWDYKSLSVDREAKAADEKMASILNATNPNLQQFRERGGKLILYHGWSDAAIPAQNTIDYYENVLKKMGARNAGSFVRLFMVPGMQHCAGGAGPSLFGQFGVARVDSRHNISAALERWVEQGTAPEAIIATKVKNGMNPANGIERTRPLCAYPKVARYKGSGNPEDAANFECVEPAK
jgi:hypothetical protein